MKATTRKFLALAATIVALCAMLSLGACSSDGDAKSTEAPANDSGYALVQEGKLTVAASLDFPPFENLVDGKAEGFEVDLMTAIAEKLGLEINYLPTQKFDTIIPTIVAGGTADVGVSGFTITPARQEEVDFSTPICDTNQAIVVLNGSDITDESGLAGKKVGGQSGTTGIDWAKENLASSEVVTFDEYSAVFAALQSGQVDAVILDKPVADYYIKVAYSDCVAVKEIPTGEQYGIAVSKDSPALTEAINKAIEELKADGTYDEIFAKWF